LDSNFLKKEVDLYIPMSVFFRHFNAYCRENNYMKPKINVDFYKAPFAKFGIRIVSKDKIRYDGKIFKNESILYGVDVVTNNYDEEQLNE
jgi:hypothetical protein